MNRISFFLLFFITSLFSQKIYHEAIDSINFGNPIEIEIFTDLQGNNISSYTLFYKKNNQTSFFRAELKSNDGSYYSAIIPQGFINNDDIYYYIELLTESNTITFPPIDPQINPIKIKIVKDKNSLDDLGETNLIDNFHIINPQPKSTIASKDLVISASYYQLKDIDINSIKIFIDDINLTSKANIKEKYLILTPNELDEGMHTIKIILNDNLGNPYNQVKWSFIIKKEDVYKDFHYSGKVFHNYFNNNVEDDIISYNTSNFLFSGSAEWIDFDIKIKETTLENSFEQPKNRYNISLKNNLINFNYGDFYPQFDVLTLNGSRVRGIGFDFYSKFFQLHLIKGQLNRSIQGKENESLSASYSEEYDDINNHSINLLTLSRIGYTFENEITAFRLGIGNYNKFNMGLNIVKVKDDIFSVDKYTDNSLINLSPLTAQYNSSKFIDINDDDVCNVDEGYDSDGDGVVENCILISNIPEAAEFVIYEKNIEIVGITDEGYSIKQEVWNIYVNYDDLDTVLDYSFSGDVDAINYLDNHWEGNEPEDNLVIGSSMKINFNRLKVNSSIGFSFYNQNIWDPVISQKELYTDNYDDCYYNRTYNQNFNDLGYYWNDCILYDSNNIEVDSNISDNYILNMGESVFDLPNPEDFDNIFHMNSSLLPTIPFSDIVDKIVNDKKITFRDFFESPEVAYDFDIRLSYPIHNINFGIKKVGVSFTSLSNPYLQNDIIEKYISDRIRLFNNKIFLFLSFKTIKNGLTDESNLSNTEKIDLNLSLYPHKKLPSLTFNYGQYIKESGSIISYEDNTDIIDNRLNTKTNNFNIYLNYNFKLFKYNHSISTSYYESKKIDLLFDEFINSDNYFSPQSVSNNYNISIKNILNEKWNTDIYISNSYFDFSKKETEFYQEQDIDTYRIGFNYKNKRIIQKIGFWIDYSLGEGTSDYSQYGIKFIMNLNLYKNLFMDIHLRNYNKNLYIDAQKGSYDNSIAKVNIAYKF